jgi:hypothetical protein
LTRKDAQDILTWSPQGRLHQIECMFALPRIVFMLLLLYFLPDAIEAVKQGGAIVGCKVFIGLFEKNFLF